MSHVLQVPFTYTDDNGNRLIVDRTPHTLSFRTTAPGGEPTGPEVTVGLSSAAILFTHLIATATADLAAHETPSPEQPHA